MTTPYFRDKRFAFSGQGGIATFDDGGRRAELDWEMRTGRASMTIFGGNCRWASPERRPMTRDEVREVVQTFATALPSILAIAFSDGEEYVEPGAK